MADYDEYDLTNLEGLKNTIRYTVKNDITYQVRVICYYKCKKGIEGHIDGFSNSYHELRYEEMLQDAINHAFFNLQCSPEKFYPEKISIIEYRPQAPYLDEAFQNKNQDTYLTLRQKYGKESVNKTEFDIMAKLLYNEPLTKEQQSKAYKINKKWDKSLKRISREIGTKKDYDVSVKRLEKAKEKARKEKKK